MIFSETKLSGAYVIDIEKIEDERGFFARTVDRNEFSNRRLDSEFVQSSISVNTKKGTLRGMHYQIDPYQESKIVTCTKGKIFDVIIDLRKNSKTYKKWVSIELSESNHRILYIPKGFVHGFQTLVDNSEVHYDITQIFSPKHSRGLKWNDSEFKIKWPLGITIISKKDSEYKPFVEIE
jgi:dTDP-4-dehydrorhamnose 3,5-epimerase